MKLYNQIRDKYKPGEIFFFEDIAGQEDNQQSILVQLCSLNKKGLIKKVGKGMYYIPFIHPLFGELYVSQEEIIKACCRKTDGYVSGPNIHNQFHLTEQVPNTITIACKRQYPDKIIQGIRLRFKKYKTSPKGKDIHILQLLDCIDQIDTIAGKKENEVLDILKNHIESLNTKQQHKLVQYSFFYPSMTRYRLTKLTPEGMRSKIRASLNKLTEHSYENRTIISKAEQ